MRSCERALLSWTTTSLLLVGSNEVAAQGYGSYEHSACSVAMGGAAVADPCSDGSAIWFNPAAVGAIDGAVLSVGGGLIAPRGDWTPNTGNISTSMIANLVPVPNLYYVKSINDRVKFGLGLWAPYGLQTEWPLDFEGRFVSYFSKLEAIYFQPTLAYRVNERLMVGAGIDVSIARVELRRRIDLSAASVPGTPFTFGRLGVPPGTDYADITMKGRSTQVGFNAGVLYKATDRMSFGARYLSRQTASSDEGELNATQIPTGLPTPASLPEVPAGTPLDALLAPLFGAGRPLQSGQAVSTELPLPDLFVGGLMVKPGDRWKVKVDYQYTNWSVFDVLVLSLENGTTETSYQGFRDTHTLRVGAEYLWRRGTAVRGGVITHNAAAPPETVTPLLAEGARVEWTLGFGHQLTPSLAVDVGYKYLHQPSREGRISNCGSERPTVQCNTGAYGVRANVLGANLTVAW